MIQGLFAIWSVAIFSVAMLLLGISIGWRTRGGHSPFPTVSNPFAKKPDPLPPPKPPKPQERA